ncbi:hypothetical protein OEZ86_005030 [Tetradesmus obliquus]|nr:hypothetical protein OEZ86_005030 [Tetradesmus obliquus]
MGLLGSCLGACFGGPGSGISGGLQEPGSLRGQQRGAAAAPCGWQTVPDDVLQAVLEYLSPAEVAVARLTCRHWRLTLSCYTRTLHLPMRFLSSKGARGALARAGQVFPGVREVTLSHAAGWCDPMQARMDVEPLVLLQQRPVSLAPLAAGLPQLSHLALADAAFSRHPWGLGQLAGCGGLRGLSLAWDTGLWAPGQVLQEGLALQPVFGLTRLSELVLAKNAHLFLGESCLGDSALAAAAAGLSSLVKLDLSTIRVQDEGFAALAALNHLSRLSLRGQLNQQQQQQQQQQQPPGLPADLDMLSRLSPLENLSCFQLHLQQAGMPQSLAMTPFALVHLAASWSRLSSLSLDIPAAAAAAAAAAAGGGPLPLLGALSGLSRLQDLSLRLADGFEGQSAAAASPEPHHHLATSRQQQQQQQQPGWSCLPSSLQLGGATPNLRHLRLLHCSISSGLLWVLARAWPSLASLVIKEAPAAGIGTSGVAAVAALIQLRALALCLEAAVDVRPLAELTGLRYLLLDGRASAELSGVKALRRLTSLRCLALPLLALHHADRGGLAALSLALPGAVLSNASAAFGLHHGCQWYKSFSLREREWWREPDLPWLWYPTLCICP